MDANGLTGNVLKIVGVLLLVLINGVFVAAEFAFVRLRDTQLDPLIAKGQKTARLARHILQNVTSYLSATQLGITMCSLGLGWFGEPVFSSLLQPILGGLKSARPTCSIQSPLPSVSRSSRFLEIVLGELGPKWIAIQKTLPTTFWWPGPCIGSTGPFTPSTGFSITAPSGCCGELGLSPSAIPI